MKRRVLQRSPDIALTLRMTKLSGQQPPLAAPAPVECPPVRILDHLGGEIEQVPAGGEYTVPECPPGGGGGCGEITGLFWRDDAGNFTESTRIWPINAFSGISGSTYASAHVQQAALVGACDADVTWSWSAVLVGDAWTPEAEVADWPDYWTGAGWYHVDLDADIWVFASQVLAFLPSGNQIQALDFWPGRHDALTEIRLGVYTVTATVADQSWSADLVLISEGY